MHSIASSLAGGRRWSRPLVSPWTIAALVLATPWAPPLVVTCGFALVSAAALRELLGPRAGVLPYLCVPLQYGFVASSSYGLMALALPLTAAIALPLWSVGAGDVRALAERSARRYFAIMIAVYALSHVPAFAMAGLAAIPWPATVAGVALAGLVAAGGARVMTRIGAPELAYVGAVAFSAPLVFYAATWIASRAA
jgi:hypothetical protein